MSSERSYLDGVPLRLSTKFFPIPRMHFKEIDIHIPIDALQEDYDFSLERSAIAEAKAWEEEQRLREERESQERLKRHNEELERLAESMSKADAGNGESKSEEVTETSLSELEEDSKEGGSETASEGRGAGVKSPPQSKISSSHSSESVPPEEETVVVSVESCGQPGLFPQEYIQTYRQDIAGAVLQPQPQICNDYDSNKPERMANKDSDHSYHQSVIPASKINLNLSDFESDTANPFDNVELNSINDMEVLASVLKNNSVTSPNPPPPPPSRTVNMNYMNGTTPMGYNSEQSHPMYFPAQPSASSYHTHPPNHSNQNFSSTWSGYYNPIPSSSSPSPAAAVTQSTNLETPPISSQSNLPPNSINSFTRFYFPLLTSMANSRANRDRNNISPFGGLPTTSNVYGNSPMIGMGPTSAAGPPIVNQNPISTPAPANMYSHNNSTQHRLVYSHSPSQLYWADPPQIGTNPYVNRLSTPPYPNEATLSSGNPSFQNTSSLSTSPNGSHPTLH